MATLKVLGFKTKKIRTLLLTQNIIFSIVGYLIGIPVGYFLLKSMLDSSG
ncbi:MAG: FtsX-like permease family protein, partial [Methanobrevibacter sp.]|nr:FtsX-like permease family protein [Methanobrevibacter sp.]